MESKQLNYLDNDRHYIKNYLKNKTLFTFWIPFSGLFLQWRFLQAFFVTNLIDRDQAWKVQSLFQIICALPTFFLIIASALVVVGVGIADTSNHLENLGNQKSFLYLSFLVPLVISVLTQPFLFMIFKKKLSQKFSIANLDIFSKENALYGPSRIRNTEKWIKTLGEYRNQKMTKWFF